MNKTQTSHIAEKKMNTNTNKTQVAAGLAGAAVGAAVGAAAAVILTDEKKRNQLNHAIKEFQTKGKMIQEKVKGRLEELSVEVEQGAQEVRKQIESTPSSPKKTTAK